MQRDASSVILFYKRNNNKLFFYFLLFTYKSVQGKEKKKMNANNISSVILFKIFIFFYL